MRRTNLSTLFSAITITLLASACNTTTTEQSQVQETTSIEEASGEPVANLKYSSVGQQTIDHLLSAYIELKDAFVATDSELAKSKAESMLSHIDEGVTEVLSSISSSAKKIISINDIEDQRAEFEEISKEIYQLIKGTENNSITIYKQSCPMAFDNKGAFWLSTEEKVINPYFGSKMLHCGKVEEILTSDN